MGVQGTREDQRRQLDILQGLVRVGPTGQENGIKFKLKLKPQKNLFLVDSPLRLLVKKNGYKFKQKGKKKPTTSPPF